MILTLDTLPRYVRTFPGAPCMFWTQGCVSTGYPQARVGRQSVLVQRYVFTELLGRTIPRGSVIRPTCRERLCVSPQCLVAVKRSRVVKDSWLEGKRGSRQEYLSRLENARRSGMARLTPEQVAAIRALDGSARSIAAQFGVSRKTVASIRAGKSWRIAPSAASAWQWRPAP